MCLQARFFHMHRAEMRREGEGREEVRKEKGSRRNFQCSSKKTEYQ